MLHNLKFDVFLIDKNEFGKNKNKVFRQGSLNSSKSTLINEPTGGSTFYRSKNRKETIKEEFETFSNEINIKMTKLHSKIIDD